MELKGGIYTVVDTYNEDVAASQQQKYNGIKYSNFKFVGCIHSRNVGIEAYGAQFQQSKICCHLQ
jgi:hypothetical protein